jgi:hypothetical protein
MGLLDGLLESVLGAGSQQAQGSMMQVALQVLEQNGGLPGIISKFEHGGMADHVGSWISPGANMPVTGAQIQEAHSWRTDPRRPQRYRGAGAGHAGEDAAELKTRLSNATSTGRATSVARHFFDR